MRFLLKRIFLFFKFENNKNNKNNKNKCFPISFLTVFFCCFLFLNLKILFTYGQISKIIVK